MEILHQIGIDHSAHIRFRNIIALDPQENRFFPVQQIGTAHRKDTAALVAVFLAVFPAVGLQTEIVGTVIADHIARAGVVAAGISRSQFTQSGPVDQILTG